MNVKKLMNNEVELSNEEIEEIVSESMPFWKKMCDAESVEVMLHPNDFGTSLKQLMLMTIAIKYAVKMNKAVTVAVD